jgi:hypothetical protein
MNAAEGGDWKILTGAEGSRQSPVVGTSKKVAENRERGDEGPAIQKNCKPKGGFTEDSRPTTA